MTSTKTEKLLCTAADEAQAGLICGLLENAQIPFVVRYPGAGVLYGSPVLFGVELYVPKSAYTSALELLEGCAFNVQELDENSCE